MAVVKDCHQTSPNRYSERLEGDASCTQASWGSNWAQALLCKGFGGRIVSGWWSDTGIRWPYVCWMWRDGSLHQKRGWSGNKRSHPWRGLSSCYHSVPYYGNWTRCLRPVRKCAYDDNPRVCDYYPPIRILSMPQLGTYHSAWVLDSHWTKRLWLVQVFGKRHRAWVRRVHG